MQTFLTKAEVADALRCSVRHVERLMGEGLPFIPVGARKKLFCGESVTRWLMSREACTISSKPKGHVPPALPSNAYTEYCAEKQAKRDARKRKKL